MDKNPNLPQTRKGGAPSSSKPVKVCATRLQGLKSSFHTI
jgi:hypothetical protein